MINLREVVGSTVRAYQERRDCRNPETAAYSMGAATARLHIQDGVQGSPETSQKLEALDLRYNRLLGRVDYKHARGLVDRYNQGLSDKYLVDRTQKMEQRIIAGEIAPEDARQLINQTQRYYNLARALAHLGGLTEYRRTLPVAA